MKKVLLKWKMVAAFFFMDHNVQVTSPITFQLLALYRRFYNGFVMQKQVYLYNLSKLSVPCYASYQQMFDGIHMYL